MISKNIFWIKVSKKIVYLILKTEARPSTVAGFTLAAGLHPVDSVSIKPCGTTAIRIMHIFLDMHEKRFSCMCMYMQYYYCSLYITIFVSMYVHTYTWDTYIVHFSYFFYNYIIIGVKNQYIG